MTTQADTVRDGVDPHWWANAWSALCAEAKSHREFDAYTLSETYDLGKPDHPNRWGSLFRIARSEGVIELAGFTVSRRPSRAGGITRTWRGREDASLAEGELT